MITPGRDFKMLSIPTILNMNPITGIALAEKYEHGNKKPLWRVGVVNVTKPSKL